MKSDTTSPDELCPECGAVVHGGPVGCQKLFDKVVAREFEDYNYFRGKRLTVDAYSLQHPDKYMRSGKCYAAHLTGTYLALENDDATTMNRVVQQWLNGQQFLARPDNPPPLQRGTLTIAHVHQADSPDACVRRVREWAESTWDAWSDYHIFAKKWVAEAMSKPAV